MALKRNKETEESRKFWEGVDRTAARVDAWPAWMRGEVQTSPPKTAPSPVPPKSNTAAEAPKQAD